MPTAQKNLKLPADVHARLKHAATTPPGEPITDFAARLITTALDRRDKAKAKKEAK